MTLQKTSLFFLIGFFLVSCSADKAPKNIIIVIADGCGFPHVAASGLYENGEAGSLHYESWPIKLAMSTYSYGGDYNPDSAHSSVHYLKKRYTDSAASGTAIASGRKTKNGMLNITPDGDTLYTILQHAKTLDKSTGVVSSVPLSHATPASFIAHNASRLNYEAIAAEMILKSGADVIMGAGHPLFNDDGQPREKARYKFVGGEDLWKKLEAGEAGNDADGDGIVDKWHKIETRADFLRLAEGETPKRLLGVPQVYSTLQQGRSGSLSKGYNPDDESIKDDNTIPFHRAFNENIPTLAEMVAAALNVLDNNPKGFFLIIEGGAVDWAAHANQDGRLIEEMADFNRTVEMVCKWVEKKSSWKETLLIVTSDHETGFLTGPGEPYGENYLPLGKGKGQTPEMKWGSGSHTNSLVPFFAKGAQAKAFLETATGNDPVWGPYLDNTDIAKTLFQVWEK
ncbi:MAG TPA: alkaline phosphatase [Candidatus Marinimicrobia bacterium]|nr:alkaline phosphatase [Candidatus Neomarinimicrobiota bacterium]